MNDDELRSILKSEGDRVDIGDDSWSRLESRLESAPVRSAPRAFALGAVAIAVVVALVVGVSWLRRNDAATHAAATPRPSRPLRPAPPIVAVRSSAIDAGPTIVLDARTGAERSPQLHNNEPVNFVSARADRSEIVFSPAPPSSCANDGGPGVQRRPILGEPVTRIVSGAFAPVVSSRDLTAYGYQCDGVGIGFTNLVTGENFRSDPFGDHHGKASPELASVTPLGWSPDGTRLLYRLVLARDSKPHFYVGALWPAVPSKKTKVIELPGGPKIVSATFIDNQRVLVAETSGRRTALREWRIGSRAKRDIPRREPSITGHVSSLVADRSGLHILAIAGGRLVWWNRGRTVMHFVADHIAAAAWLGSR